MYDRMGRMRNCADRSIEPRDISSHPGISAFYADVNQISDATIPHTLILPD